MCSFAKTLFISLLVLGLLVSGPACSADVSLSSRQAPESSGQTAAIAANSSTNTPSVITKAEGSRVKRTFEEEIAFSDACVIGNAVASVRDPDSTLDCLFEIDEVIYGDISEKFIHVHQLPEPDLRVNREKRVLLLYEVDSVFYPHIRYYPMGQFDLPLNSEGALAARGLQPDWPAEAFTSLSRFAETVIRIKRQNLPVDPSAKIQARYTRETDPAALWNHADFAARIVPTALNVQGTYSAQYRCTVLQTLKGAPLPSEVLIHLLPDTEAGKTYLVLLAATTPGKAGTTYSLSSLNSQVLAGSEAEKAYIKLGFAE